MICYVPIESLALSLSLSLPLPPSLSLSLSLSLIYPRLLKKVVALRLSEHLDKQNLNEPFQSAYRRLHSTETALLRVCRDSRAALDGKGGRPTPTMLLDLSSAFDTIVHTILLNRLSKRYGIQGYVQRWIASDLQDSKQKVEIGQATSVNHMCNTGVPQGSMLGPALF